MSTTRIDSQYSIFDARNEFLPANEIYITISGLGQRRIDTLYYGDVNRGNLKPITSYKQLVTRYIKDMPTIRENIQADAILFFLKIPFIFIDDSP